MCAFPSPISGLEHFNRPLQSAVGEVFAVDEEQPVAGHNSTVGLQPNNDAGWLAGLFHVGFSAILKKGKQKKKMKVCIDPENIFI
jgi:hypothetical protein